MSSARLSSGPKLKVLILEDDQILRKALLGRISTDFPLATTMVVASKDDFVSAIRSHEPDVVLLNPSVQSYAATDALKDVRKQGCHAPVIVVNGSLPESEALSMLNNGFEDYFLRDAQDKLAASILKASERYRLYERLRQDEELLKHRHEQFKYLFDHSGDEIYILDARLCNILDANPRAAERTGYTREELTEMDMAELISHENRISGLYRFQHVCDQGEEMFETEHLRKDGTTYPVEVDARCMVTGGGRKLVQAFVRDITHRKRVEALMQESEAKFQELFSSINDVFYHTDMDGVITLVSPSISSLLGYKAYELIGRKMSSFYAIPSRRHYFMAELMEKGEVRHWETELKHRDGQSVFVSSNSSLVKDANGVVTGVQGVIRDISDRIESRKQRQEFTKQLEEKVKERTRELESTNLMLMTEVRERHRISKVLEAKNQDLTDSILYAERLQKAILPEIDVLRKTFPESFVLYKPRDIVGGDFYWFHRIRKNFLLACVDCTGHGVPGGFMTMACNEMLNKTVIDKGWHHPSLVLELMDSEIRDTFQKYSKESITDGMDMSYVNIDSAECFIEFAGAGQGLLLVKDDEIRWFRGSKFGLGGDYQGKDRKFETHKIPYTPGECLYLFSDGYADQFGGEKDRKFMMRNFKNLIQSVYNRPMVEQVEVLNLTFDRWRGSSPQVDDITVMGVRL